MPWTAINCPGQDRRHIATQVSLQESNLEPPKKRRKKNQEDGPPSSPKPNKTKKATSKQPKTRKSSRKSIQIESSELKSSSRVVLSETTRNKLTAYRHNVLPTPASEGFNHQKTNKENIVSKISPVKSSIAANPESCASDPLSDDLWRNQERQPEYPWLYRNSDFNIDAIPMNDTDATESRLFAQMVEMNGQEQRYARPDSSINDQELERLMDEVVHEEPFDCTESDIATLRFSSIERVPSTIGEVADDAFDLDNFDLEDDELDMLCKATNPLIKPPTVEAEATVTGVAKGNNNQDSKVQPIKDDTSAKGTVPPVTIYSRTRRSKVSPSKPDGPRLKTLEDSGFKANESARPVARKKTAATPDDRSNKSPQTDIDATDLDDTDFQDMSDLMNALPDSPLENPMQPQTIKDPTRTAFSVPHIDLTITSAPSTAPANPPTPFQQSSSNIRQRFIRPAHPSPLSTPSPIPGLSPQNQILTCFRLGEAINTSIHFHRQNPNQQLRLPTVSTTTTITNPGVTIEFYARVIHSVRAGPIQTFRFVDLYSTSDKPGLILEGRWEGWQRSQLWKEDGRCFWEDSMRGLHIDSHGQERRVGRKVRVVGTLIRKGEDQGQGSRKWIVNVLNLWAAGWDDVLFTREAVL